MTKQYTVKGYDLLNLLSAKASKKEKLSGDDDPNNTIKISGTALAIFITLNLALWIWALTALIQRQNTSNPLSTVPLIFAILGLIGFIVPGGPLLTLILVYVVK